MGGSLLIQIPVRDAVITVATRPKTKTIMVLADQNQTGKPVGPDCTYNFVGIEGGRIEKRGGIVAGPFRIGERIHFEVKKYIGFRLMPRELAFARNHPEGRRS